MQPAISLQAELGLATAGAFALTKIEVAADQELDLVAEVRFSDAVGNAIESQAAGSSTMRSSDKVTTNLSYSLRKMVAKAVVTVVFWDDLRKVEVPYDLTIGLGQH